MTLALTAAAALAAGYLLGLGRPLHSARRWAWWTLAIGRHPGRLRGTALVCLLPEQFAPIIWHRVRHGTYPEPPPRRVHPTPAVVNRRHDPEETR